MTLQIVATGTRRPTFLSLQERLVWARESYGLTQQQLADHLGVSKRSVLNYEKGDQQLKPGRLLLWANVTDVDLDWLRDGDLAFPAPRESAEVASFVENTVTSDQKVRGSNPFGCTSG